MCPIKRHRAIADQRFKAMRRLQHGARVCAVTFADGAEIDLEIAHQPFDYGRPPAVIVAKRVAAGDGHSFVFERARPVAEIQVLCVALRQCRDGRRAEAQDRIGGAGDIALKGAAQRPLLRRTGQRVAGRIPFVDRALERREGGLRIGDGRGVCRPGQGRALEKPSPPLPLPCHDTDPRYAIHEGRRSGVNRPLDGPRTQARIGPGA